MSLVQRYVSNQKITSLNFRTHIVLKKQLIRGNNNAFYIEGKIEKKIEEEQEMRSSL